MKAARVFLVFGLCLVGAVPTSCGSKRDVTSELQKAAAAMAKPEPAQEAPPAAEAPQQTPSSPAAQMTIPVQAQGQEMNQAIAAYKADDLQDAVRRLQNLRHSPVMSAEKRMALNDAMAAVMTEIYARAAKGDASAIQAVKLAEQMQTQRH
jgi:hypothetical protein